MADDEHQIITTHWASENGIRYSWVANPMSPRYASSSELDIGRAGSSGEQRRTRARMKNGTYRTKATGKMRDVSLRGQHNSGRGAAAEVALQASSGLYNWSVRHAFWRDITEMETQIRWHVERHGGVMIIGRLLMMKTPNPDTGVRQAFYRDAYLAGGAASVQSYFYPESAPKPQAPAYVGPQQLPPNPNRKPSSGASISAAHPHRGAQIGTAAYQPPEPITPGASQMVERMKVWARAED